MNRQAASQDERIAAQVAAIHARDHWAIARAISAIEHGAATSRALLDALADSRGRAHVVGITGPPGAGKSTLVNAVVLEYLARDIPVAVVAVDPTSPLTGGAVLGDRVRMGASGSDDRVFIRSLASRGHPGGVSRATSDSVDVLDAAGFPLIIVETVGAGQSDVAIATLADTTVVVSPPGLGDDVQAIKAGILEVADILVVSKGDLPNADRALGDLRDMLKLRGRSARGVPVLVTSASRREGIPALVDAIAAHVAAHGRRRAARLAKADTGEVVDLRERANGLHASDAFMRSCEVALIDVGAGHATLRMTVRREHLNFLGSCHGGALFSLADGAFGLASNTHGPISAAIDAHIAFHVAAREGDELTACASEVSRSRQVATYRVDVERGDGVRIASFTGTVFRRDASR